MDHVLSELSTMTRPSWVALHGMAHSFTELDKAVVHVIRLVSFLCGFQSVCPLMEKDKRLTEASCWERLTEGKTGSYRAITPAVEAVCVPAHLAPPGALQAKQLCSAGAVSGQEEIPHVQGQRNPSKMVSAGRGHQRTD